MTFVPEDGTGLPNATSFVDVAYADAYFAEIGNAAWGGTEPEKEGYLTNATRYIITIFGRRFCCWTKLDPDQSLPFPTEELGMPEALLWATCEYAVRAKAGPLLPDPTMDASGFTLIQTRRKVGPLERQYGIAGNQSQPQLVRSYPYPDSLMAGLLCAGGGGTRVIR